MEILIGLSGDMLTSEILAEIQEFRGVTYCIVEKGDKSWIPPGGLFIFIFTSRRMTRNRTCYHVSRVLVPVFQTLKKRYPVVFETRLLYVDQVTTLTFDPETPDEDIQPMVREAINRIII